MFDYRPQPTGNLAFRVEQSMNGAYGVVVEEVYTPGEPTWYHVRETTGYGEHGVMLCPCPTGGWDALASDCTTVLGHGPTLLDMCMALCPYVVATCLFQPKPPRSTGSFRNRGVHTRF